MGKIVTAQKQQVIMLTPRLWRGVKQFYYQFMGRYEKLSRIYKIIVDSKTT
jgi:hypothetical protein